MKRSSLPSCLVVAALGAIAAAIAPVASAAEPAASPTSAGLMRTAYLALVHESIVPADPRVVATAALAKIAALAPERAPVSLPIDFGGGAERDAAWLAERVSGMSPPWPVFDAMARATRTAHVGLGSPQKKQGIGALMAGHPLAAPGFNLLPLDDGRLVVFDVVPGASADASGLRAGDVLVRIDGERAMRLDVFLINTLPAGTELTLDIERANHAATIVLRLIKANVPSVESRLLDDGSGYVFIRWFAHSDDTERDTAALACRAFTSLAAQGARGLILDLRSSLGGTGEVKIASALCDGDVIYAVRQPLTAPARPVKREGERCWPDRPIVVLVNEHTISAGEALALALRELAHAQIVGRTTGGALTEMSFVPLAEGYSMTIPTGVDIGPVTGEDQPGHAVKPDMDVANPGIDELVTGRDSQLDAARAALR